MKGSRAAPSWALSRSPACREAGVRFLIRAAGQMFPTQHSQDAVSLPAVPADNSLHLCLRNKCLTAMTEVQKCHLAWSQSGVQEQNTVSYIVTRSTGGLGEGELCGPTC